MEKKQYYSIRKHKKGAVSVLLFTALFAVAGVDGDNIIQAGDISAKIETKEENSSVLTKKMLRRSMKKH